jgi:transcriptional regulator with XRE-family HTH domain
MDQSNKLGEFLRARRDQVSPQQAGLPPDGVRRVAGLRREEVALLAGVNVDYYTRLEQGRERHPSEQVLDAVARVLRLDADAAAHLFSLAQPSPHAVEPVASAQVDETVRLLLTNVIGAPACVVGPALDILAANPLAEVLYRGFGRLDNLMRMVFLDPAARSFYGDWDAAASGAVASLRALSSPFLDDPRVTAVIGELTVRSPAFVELWSRHEVRPRAYEKKLLHHPDVGDVQLHFRSLGVTGTPGQQLFTYFADPGSPAADALILMRRLVAAHGDDTAGHGQEGPAVERTST